MASGLRAWELLAFTVRSAMWVKQSLEESSLLHLPGPKKFKLSNTELIYKAKQFKVPPFTIQESLWLKSHMR